ncbi:MAG: hypothetical protein GAK31_00372 [Stenotrophomonas maltophilia]|uniref:Transmembrane protein n=1 Tax=Stenotrophomonas maltophilia TaxID=40324 RepID=A0A7V8JMZ6_STEMA|nr:MAG: hypothetical protein GAK31_00372 [Stenotrophomonas maltophilia]
MDIISHVLGVVADYFGQRGSWRAWTFLLMALVLIGVAVSVIAAGRN